MRPLRAGLLVAGVAGLIGVLFVWRQMERERAIDVDDIDRRARAIAHVLSYTVHDALRGPPANVPARLGERLEGHSRLLGCAVF